VTLTDKGVEDPLFAGIERNFVTYQWHDDSFDLPPGCLLLASSPDCPHQSFRHGACVYGVQFHPEVNAAIVESWSGAVAREAGVLHDHLVDFLRAEEEYLVTARALFDNFLRIARLVP
jgi:GMP synthase-like glutamine amidotransferase